ncbi:MAG: hypothetical protein ACI90V_004584 [Bacillariaceae sp.]
MDYTSNRRKHIPSLQKLPSRQKQDIRMEVKRINKDKQYECDQSSLFESDKRIHHTVVVVVVVSVS